MIGRGEEEDMSMEIDGRCDARSTGRMEINGEVTHSHRGGTAGFLPALLSLNLNSFVPSVMYSSRLRIYLKSEIGIVWERR